MSIWYVSQTFSIGVEYCSVIKGSVKGRIRRRADNTRLTEERCKAAGDIEWMRSVMLVSAARSTGE